MAYGGPGETKQGRSRKGLWRPTCVALEGLDNES